MQNSKDCTISHPVIATFAICCALLLEASSHASVKIQAVGTRQLAQQGRLDKRNHKHVEAWRNLRDDDTPYRIALDGHTIYQTHKVIDGVGDQRMLGLLHDGLEFGPTRAGDTVAFTVITSPHNVHLDVKFSGARDSSAVLDDRRALYRIDDDTDTVHLTAIQQASIVIDQYPNLWIDNLKINLRPREYQFLAGLAVHLGHFIPIRDLPLFTNERSISPEIASRVGSTVARKLRTHGVYRPALQRARTKGARLFQPDFLAKHGTLVGHIENQVYLGGKLIPGLRGKELTLLQRILENEFIAYDAINTSNGSFIAFLTNVRRKIEQVGLDPYDYFETIPERRGVARQPHLAPNPQEQPDTTSSARNLHPSITPEILFGTNPNDLKIDGVPVPLTFLEYQVFSTIINQGGELVSWPLQDHTIVAGNGQPVTRRQFNEVAKQVIRRILNAGIKREVIRQHPSGGFHVVSSATRDDIWVGNDKDNVYFSGRQISKLSYHDHRLLKQLKAQTLLSYSDIHPNYRAAVGQIKGLRKKIRNAGLDPDDYFETVWGLGIRLKGQQQNHNNDASQFLNVAANQVDQTGEGLLPDDTIPPPHNVIVGNHRKDVYLSGQQIRNITYAQHRLLDQLATQKLVSYKNIHPNYGAAISRIGSLRQKIRSAGLDPNDYLETVRGVGVRLIAPIGSINTQHRCDSLTKVSGLEAEETNNQSNERFVEFATGETLLGD